MTTGRNILTGCAGEHFVAYRLSDMGYLVALTRGGSPSVDLMVGTTDGRRTVTIQVKTGNDAFRTFKKKPENNYWVWRVSGKAAELRAATFYAFVDLKHRGEAATPKGVEMPDVFIVPAEFVAQRLAKNPGWFWLDEKEREEWGKWRNEAGCRLIKEKLGPSNPA